MAISDSHDDTPISLAYPYVTIGNRLVYEVQRRPGKKFVQRRPDPDRPGEWLWNLAGIERVPYRWPEIDHAADTGGTVFVVEGEKDADRLAAIGVPATTSAGGANWAWPNEWAEHFLGCQQVVVIADNDPPGQQAAHQRASVLLRSVPDVRVIAALPGVADKGDISDWLDQGHTLDDLWKLAEAAPNLDDHHAAADTPTLLEVVRPFRRIPLDITATPPLPTFIARWIYAAGLTVLQSEPGVGKTWIAAWLAVAALEAGYSVVYIDEEGGPDLITERLVALGADPELVNTHLHYFAFEHRHWNDEDLAALDQLIATITPPFGLAILDSLPDFLAAANLSEDSAQDVTTFIARVCSRFRDAGAAQLVLDHLPKPPAEGKAKRSRYGRGSGAKLAKADATLLLETGSEFDAHTSGWLRLWKTKDRRGRLILPPLTKDPLRLDVKVDVGGVTITEIEGVQIPEGDTWDGPTECMAAALTVLESARGTEFSKRNLGDAIRSLGHRFQDRTVAEAAARLVVDGRIQFRRGPRNAELYSLPAGPDADQPQEMDW